MRGSEPWLPRWARQISGILRTFSSSPANCQEWCCTMISSRWSGPLKKVKNRRWSGYTGSLAITVVNLLISWHSPINFEAFGSFSMQRKYTIVFSGFVHRSCSLVYRMRGGPRIQVSYNQQKTRRRMKWSKKPSCSGSALRTPGLCSVLHISCFLVTLQLRPPHQNTTFPFQSVTNHFMRYISSR